MAREKPINWLSYLGIGLVVASYIGAIVNTFTIGKEIVWTNKKVIRICHWQLESGFREAVTGTIAAYEKLHPDVKIIQIPITDKAYRQFLITQLIGGTAPDLIEFGQLGAYGALDNVTARYFYPLGQYLKQPNEYNVGTNLEGVPWVHTFKHELEYNWDPNNLDYYSIGITGVSQRLAYNKQLMKAITGKETPPQTFREFIAFCKGVQHYADSTKQKIYPIAAARYQFEGIASDLGGALTRTIGLDSIDRNYNADGDPGIEGFTSWVEGKFSFASERAKAASELSKEIVPFLEPGFMARDRQDAAFSFAQQRAVIIPTWSWDMNSQVGQAKESGFDIGIMRFPLPDSTDAVYGKYVEGYAAESKSFDMPFAVCRFSQHPDIAIDFLRFYSSQKVAETFCKKIGWLCTVRGTENIDFMQGFEPSYKGYPNVGSSMTFGNETDNLSFQLRWEYFSGKTTFDSYVNSYSSKFLPVALKDCNSSLMTLRNSLPSAAQTISHLSLLHEISADTAQEAKVLLRLQNSVDGYAGYWASLQAFSYDFMNAMTQDNERTRAIKNELQYKMFRDDFVNVPPAPQGGKP